MCIIELCTVVFLDYNVYADINLPQIWVETQSLSDLGDLCTFYVMNLHIYLEIYIILNRFYTRHVNSIFLSQSKTLQSRQLKDTDAPG